VHGIDQRNDVVLLDVEVLDGALEEFFFRRHSVFRISTFWSGLARVLCEFLGLYYRHRLHQRLQHTCPMSSRK
jgi:hypothetical protein